MHIHYALLSLSLGLTAHLALAQTLDNSNNTPVAGDVFMVHQASYLPPGAGGAGQTWDFAALSAGTTTSLTYVTPAATSHAASFPGSTVAGDAGGGNYVFYTGSATGFELRGVYSSTIAEAIVYQDPEQLLAYPCSYNTSWSDNFSANFSSLGTPVARAGNITGVADGYGTLIMPYGTVTNVLRVRIVEDYSDVLSGFGSIDYDFISYNYIKPGVRTPLLTLNDNTTTTLGTPETSQTALWHQGAGIGIDEAMANAIGIDLFPNPATDHVTVVYSSEGGSLRLELIDGSGRLVRVDGITAGMGIGRQDLDVNGIAPGLYQVRIIAANGQMGVQRLMVQ